MFCALQSQMHVLPVGHEPCGSNKLGFGCATLAALGQTSAAAESRFDAYGLCCCCGLHVLVPETEVHLLCPWLII